jgi:hypothetical protein
MTSISIIKLDKLGLSLGPIGESLSFSNTVNFSKLTKK